MGLAKIRTAGSGAKASAAAPVRARGRRRSKAPLTKARIVAAALALIARDGLGRFSARRLGEALGVEAMSVYHHFPSKQHLLDALVDHAIADVEFLPDGPPIERLRAVLYAYRAMAHRYPQLYPLVALHRLNTPTGVRFIERVLALVHEIVKDPEQCARQFRAVGYFLMGAALDETSGYARGPSAALPVDDAYIAAHCPHLAAAARYFRPAEWDATFAVGVEALFAGFGAAPAARAVSPPARQRGGRATS